jgi:hypothetical protein
MRPIVFLPPISLLQENDIKEQPPKRCIFADFRGLFYVRQFFAAENTMRQATTRKSGACLEITNYKIQITNKLQITKKSQTGRGVRNVFTMRFFRMQVEILSKKTQVE